MAVAMIAATVVAFNPPTPEERQSVKLWDDTMKHFGRDYEMHKVTTEDDWELTVFRLMPSSEAKQQGEKSEGSLLIGHGSGMDATMWFTWFA